jgi:hypothetical protein
MSRRVRRKGGRALRSCRAKGEWAAGMNRGHRKTAENRTTAARVPHARERHSGHEDVSTRKAAPGMYSLRIKRRPDETWKVCRGATTSQRARSRQHTMLRRHFSFFKLADGRLRHGRFLEQGVSPRSKIHAQHAWIRQAERKYDGEARTEPQEAQPLCQVRCQADETRFRLRLHSCPLSSPTDGETIAKSSSSGLYRRKDLTRETSRQAF